LNNKINSKIPNSSDPKSEIVDYLKSHGIVSEDEIAQALNLHIIDVLDALLELEKKGVTVRVDEVESLGN
jgi:predicted ArsR family transcriptional regulator